MATHIQRQDWQRLRRIFGYLLRYKLIFAGGVCVTFLFGLVETAVPWLMYLLLDADEAAPWIGEQHLALVLFVAIVALTVLRSVLGYARIYWNMWMQGSMSRALRYDMVRHLVKLPQSYHDNESSGILVSRVMQFVDVTIDNIVGVLISLLQDSARLLGYMATIFIVEWRYALLVVLVMPLAMKVVAFFTHRLRVHSDKRVIALSELTGSLSDTVRGHTVIAAYGGQRREVDKLGRQLDRVRGLTLRQGIAQGLNMSLSQLLLALVLAVIFGLLARDLTNGELSEGQVSTFIFAMVLLPLPLRNLTRLAEQVQLSLASAARVFELLDAAPEANSGTFAPAQVQGEIKFAKVDFSYASNPQQQVLDGFEMTIAAGETVALVGPSGGGKSTVASLLLRLYAPAAGSISLDGRDLVQWDLQALRKAVGIVSQQVVLFDTTLAENVAYPDVAGQIDQQRLQRALQDAQLGEMVAALPEQEHTLLGENGMRLSGGERQRLAIARALYKDARVLVLDEVTSALDSQTEQLIKQSLVKLRANRTVLVIAHRFATAELADRVVVLNHGKVAATGSHAELMASSQMYRSLYEAQQLEA